MSTSLVGGFLPGTTSDQLGTAKAATASITSEKASDVTPIAPGQHQAEDSLESACVMIGTVLNCFAMMIAVVIASAASMF